MIYLSKGGAGADSDHTWIRPAYKQWYALTATHFTLYFHPLHQPKTPVFAKNCHPKSYFCHCPEFWKFFTQRPLISWNLQGTQMPPPFFSFFYDFCHWKTPYFFCLAYTCLFERNVAPSNTVRSWNILYSRNRIEQFGEYFHENYMDEFHWRAGMIYRLLST